MKIKFDSKELKNICKTSNISFLGLFGSHAVGEQRLNSDVDLLVDFNKTKSLFEKGRVLVKLQNLFRKEVDLVSRKNIKPSIKPYIEKQLVTLYEEK
mgnify:CR=1 FL=1